MIQVFKRTTLFAQVEPDGKEFLHTRTFSIPAEQYIATVYTLEEAQALIVARYLNPHKDDKPDDKFIVRGVF